MGRVRVLHFTLVAVLLGSCLTVTPPVAQSAPSTSPAASGEPADPSTACSIDFRLVCEAVDLIQLHYVDTSSLPDLATAAVRGIDEFAQASGAQPDCHIPLEGFAVVCRRIDEKGVEAEEAVEAALIGMIQYELDANSAYFDEASLRLINQDQLGRVEGIGAAVTTAGSTDEDIPCAIISESCRLVIVSTFSGAPAEAAGIKEGDVIVEVDG
jgi:hypothetical protein